MNPTSPTPAPEGEVPPRVWIAATWLHAPGANHYPVSQREDGLPYDIEKPEYLSLQEHSQILSAEKQRGLRAVGEARASAFRECEQEFHKRSRLSFECWLGDQWKEWTASRAAKEPS